jgi:hypothetical protein
MVRTLNHLPSKPTLPYAMGYPAREDTECVCKVVGDAQVLQHCWRVGS